jgi:nucleoside-diphosphate-sugar epimerase
VDIAVLGASGFIGSAMTEHLRGSGHDVLALTRSDGDLTAGPPDLRGARVVYNFAADMGGVAYFHTHDFWPALSNGRITANVLQACVEQGVERVFMASSACAYPIHLQRRRPAHRLEESELESGVPDQMYGREKLLLTRLAERAPLDARVGILHTIYGDPFPRGQRTKFPTDIAAKMLAARDSGTVEIWGDGLQERSYLWIDDAVAKIAAIMDDDDNPGPTNVGYQGSISVQHVAELCADIVGIRPTYTYTDAKPSGVRARDCSNAAFWGRYGRMEPTDYRSGFAQLIERLEAA